MKYRSISLVYVVLFLICLSAGIYLQEGWVQLFLDYRAPVLILLAFILLLLFSGGTKTTALAYFDAFTVDVVDDRIGRYRRGLNLIKQGGRLLFLWGGVGALVNRTGKDHYWCEPLSADVYRPDFHSKDSKLNYSYAQGCGVGRRGDITDGHSWAGGMGTIIDLEGNDVYESANWSLGCGYWYGMGFAYDGGGDDTYKSASWSQAAGAHFCIGANLARMEIKLIFNEIADQIPDISKLGEPQRLRSGWINGVKHLPVSYRG